MKSFIEVWVFGSLLICGTSAQDSPKPSVRKGISVQMAVANHAVEMPAADKPETTVVAITAEGKLYAGIEPTQPGELSNLSAETVYVKADSRAPFQMVLTVLDALRGKSLILLAALPSNVERAKPVSPYGMKVVVPR